MIFCRAYGFLWPGLPETKVVEKVHNLFHRGLVKFRVFRIPGWPVLLGLVVGDLGRACCGDPKEAAPGHDYRKRRYQRDWHQLGGVARLPSDAEQLVLANAIHPTKCAL